ncbi:MAG: sensor histidine kinase [Luteimonas sp.]
MIASLQWLDRLAHDLRGPLTPLQTAAYLLRSGQVTPDRQQELFALIERQTRQLGGMIDELGDWTRVAQDRLLGSLEPCEPALLLDYARANSGTAGASAILEQHAEGVLVHGDPLRLTQLLRILLEYAGARGEPPVSIVIRTEGGQLCIDLHVGAGALDPQQVAQLLEQPERDPYDQGLGLRLLIARSIAEAHRGSLTAGIEDGRLAFHCRLPLHSA